MRNICTPRQEIEGYEILEELALDLIWSWNHRADKIWKQLDPQIWEITHNPWVILQTISQKKLQETLSDPTFRKIVEDLLQETRKEAKSPRWFQKSCSNTPLTQIAYFSMEFMLSESLPIYSGGLGNVAGDQLKAASDLGVPVVGIGLLYQQGYFRQWIDNEGAQHAVYPFNSPEQLPIQPLRKPDGEWFILEIPLPGWPLRLRIWEVKIGRTKLYLLDTNDPANLPLYRGITSELYGGDSELRLQQELILGIGGWRLLDSLGIKPEVCHLNEGHAAFAVLERAYCFMKEMNVSFETAFAATRAGNLFTTHTAVPAGFDRFSPALIEKYLGNFAKTKLQISMEELLSLGRQNPNEPFNMAYLAIRGSGSVNGVSRLHGAVSRHLFSPLFPRWPIAEVPVKSVTNGVHVPTWDMEMADAIWTEYSGKDHCWRGPAETLEQDLRPVPDEKLWEMRNSGRKTLVEFCRKRLSKMLEVRGMPADEVEKSRHHFDPNVLTLGFARRFATYKRPNLLLHDPERLMRILTNPERPAQLVMAGKAHPADKAGQELIQQWIQFIVRPEVRSHIIFLGDYDMLMTEKLVQGVDVWINTPRRPWEACGTSGMKILVNGGLNISELDGWWAEAYSSDIGWALGDGKEHGDDPAWDAQEAAHLYDLLEKEVIPEFYDRKNGNPPARWLTRVRESMARLTPRFSANRAVQEYTEKHYIPAATCYRSRSADQGSHATKLVNWQNVLSQNWQKIHFGEVKVETKGSQHLFEAKIDLNGLNTNSIRLELFALGLKGDAPSIQEMKHIGEAENYHIYRVAIPSTRPASDYTARAIPSFPGASVPLEAPYILWQR